MQYISSVIYLVMVWKNTLLVKMFFLYSSICMAGTVNALASLSIVISTGVLSLTCQTVHLQIQQRANKQRNVIQIAAGSFFYECIKKRLEATSALMMNCSVAAFSFSLCPLQALSADACRARPKENVRTQGLGRGQLLMALRWIEASSSL